MATRCFRAIGAGRAGLSFVNGLTSAGWDCSGVLHRGDNLADAATGVDLLLIATPDAAIAATAAAVEPNDDTVVAHLSGALGLGVLAPHRRRAGIHPLMTLPDGETGARLLRGGWFAVNGDDLAHEVVAAFAGRTFIVADEQRATYHAAAVVASNHVTVLLGQVQRLAAQCHVPFEAFAPIAAAAVGNAFAFGPARALTGPAARGDSATIAAHLAALAPTERPLYRALAEAAGELARQREEED